MTYDPSPLFDALQSKLAASGFQHTLIAEPTDPPAQPTAVVMFTGIELTEHTLPTSSGLVKFNLRFYYNALQEPRAGKEKDVAKFALDIMQDLAGDYDLGQAAVRNIEPGMMVNAGFQMIGQTMYRVSDLIVNIMVNDLVTWTE